MVEETKTIAESKNFIVLDRYEGDWGAAAGYQSETDLENELIRDMQDRGVLILCDPRLVHRPYGATFLQSLPPMPRCRDLAAINRFWLQSPASASAAASDAASTHDSGSPAAATHLKK